MATHRFPDLGAALRPGPLRTGLLVAAAAALVGGLLVAYPRTESRRPFAPPAAAAATPQPAPLRVSVAGAVQRPGPYAVREGERVEDLIDLAGGALPDADLDRVNLAARLKDGQRVNVPVRRQARAPTPVISPDQPLDLNQATKEDLVSLTGIGDVRARNILESRAADGPFRDPADLVARKLVPPSVFNRIKDRLTVK